MTSYVEKNEIRTLKLRMWMKRAGVHRWVRKRLTIDVTLWMSLTMEVTATQLRWEEDLLKGLGRKNIINWVPNREEAHSGYSEVQEHQLGDCKIHHEEDRWWHGPEQQRWTGGKKWWNWRCILRIELMKFGDRLAVEAR